MKIWKCEKKPAMCAGLMRGLVYKLALAVLYTKYISNICSFYGENQK
jgi:hypothetical protein